MKRSLASIRLAVLAVVVPLAALPSCATSSGGTYSRSSSSESGAAREGERRPSSPAPRPAPRPSPSRHDEGRVVVVEKEPRGSLVLDGLPSDASVYVDGLLRFGSRHELPAGSHVLRVSRFGFEDFTATIQISIGGTTVIGIAQMPAAFALVAAEAKPPAFDPRDPGYLGSTRVEIEASAPGEGRLAVLDDRGREIKSFEGIAFDSRSVVLRWDGRDDEGRVLEPGAYALVATGIGRDGAAGRAEARVSIETGRVARTALLHDGVSGALFAPDARCIEAGGVEATTGAVVHVRPESSGLAGLGTFEAGVRVGLLDAPAGLELDASAMAVAWPGDPLASSASATLALKLSIEGEDGSRATAAYVKATAAGFTDPLAGDARPSWDGATRYAGVSVGVPFEADFGASRLFVAPEIEVSDYYPYWYGSSLPLSPPGLFAWGYLRAGLEASVGRNFTLGVSGALRTDPFGAGFAVRWPLPLGLELRWHSPDIPLALSLAATGEIDSLDSYYFGAGAFATLRL